LPRIEAVVAANLDLVQGNVDGVAHVHLVFHAQDQVVFQCLAVRTDGSDLAGLTQIAQADHRDIGAGLVHHFRAPLRQQRAHARLDLRLRDAIRRNQIDVHALQLFRQRARTCGVKAASGQKTCRQYQQQAHAVPQPA
tara:strand:+ start:1894 stop:2307 length:414 start_codon:yes stop_codon:yes gene_type:complete